MEETIPTLIPIKEAAEIIGCSDKVIRNYIKDGKISFQSIESPYGQQYIVDPDEIRDVYNSKRSSTLEKKNIRFSSGISSPEPPVLKDILPVMLGLQTDYKQAMEKIHSMAYELGNAHKEVKLLTGDSMEKSALEKQIQSLIQEKTRLEVLLEAEKEKNTRLEERLSSLELSSSSLDSSHKNSWMFWKR
jgi:hypothetical protein